MGIVRNLPSLFPDVHMHYALARKQVFNSVSIPTREIDEDITRLKTIAVGILSDLGFHGSTLSEDLIHEMCRFGGAELHVVAAFTGGVASQEVIKVWALHELCTAFVLELAVIRLFCDFFFQLITKQFVPITGTLIFNGIDHKSQVLAL